MKSPADDFPDVWDSRLVTIETAAACMGLPTAILLQAFAMEDYYPAADTLTAFGDARRVVRAYVQWAPAPEIHRECC